jgi:GDP-4-dehydro-6-deoxy-D-mannose reductase
VPSPVLITGGHGFVARHLARELGEAAVISDVDVTDADALGRVLRESQAEDVVHLAALSQVSESWADPVSVWTVNAVGTVAVLDAVRRERPGARVLVVSTGEVYGRATVVPTPEDAPVQPVSPYAASKAAAELAATQAAAAGLDIVIARAFQHEGPGRDDRFAIGSWTLQLAELELVGGGMLKVGNLAAERDISDVRDVCRAYRLLLDRAVPREIYNVASGQTVTLERVVEELVALVDVPIRVERDPARMRPVDLPVVWGDASKLRRVTGWEPLIPLEQTLRDTLGAARQAVRAGKMAT